MKCIKFLRHNVNGQPLGLKHGSVIRYHTFKGDVIYYPCPEFNDNLDKRSKQENNDGKIWFDSAWVSVLYIYLILCLSFVQYRSSLVIALPVPTNITQNTIISKQGKTCGFPSQKDINAEMYPYQYIIIYILQAYWIEMGLAINQQAETRTSAINHKIH